MLNYTIDYRSVASWLLGDGSRLALAPRGDGSGCLGVCGPPRLDVPLFAVLASVVGFALVCVVHLLFAMLFVMLLFVACCL